MRLSSLKRVLRNPSRSHSKKHHLYRTSQPRELRRLFTIFCAALLLESVALQLISTADGSEVAFNPDPVTNNTAIQSPAIGAVASVNTTNIHETPQVTQANQEVTSSHSLITHANAAAPATPLSSPSLIFRTPLTNYTLTQYFSSYHTAIDMAAPTGTAVYATTEGVVANTGYLLPGGGLMVRVDHGGGYSSYYAHLSAITVQIGQGVNNSTQIARVGSTGWATGPHLHFMIWKNEQAVNPLSLIK